MSDSIKLIPVALDCRDAGARIDFLAAPGYLPPPVQPGDHFRVYADPAGHPFCRCAEDGPGQG